MRRKFAFLLIAGGLGWCAAAAPAWEMPADGDAGSAPMVAFPLDLAVIDPDAKDKLPPYIVMFEEGLDSNGKDVRRPLGRLEALRGPSKMFPESNQDDGLPVVLRGLRLHRKADANGDITGYEVELQGEFNMIKVPAGKKDVEKFLAGQAVTFTLKGEKNFGIYAYVSTMKMELQLSGDEVAIRHLVGDFTFREGFSTYSSKTKKLTSPTSRDYLYRGQRAELPMLPSI